LFSVLRLPQLYFKWGVPQTPENNTKVLLKEVIYLKQAKAWSAAQQNRAILHNTHALCAMRGQEKRLPPHSA